MQVSLQLKFSSSVAKQFKNKLRKDIVNSVEGSPELRKEMRRVFQQANRRIQNIEKAGVFSPAVAALGKGDIQGYSKFTVKGFGNTGNDWKALKKEYAKAISFLNQPTSSASGAKEFEAQVKKQMGIDDELWKKVRESVIGNYNSVSSELLLALPYSDFMQEVYSRAQHTSSEQIEREAVDGAKRLEDSIQQQADKVSGELTDEISEILENLASGFKIEF